MKCEDLKIVFVIAVASLFVSCGGNNTSLGSDREFPRNPDDSPSYLLVDNPSSYIPLSTGIRTQFSSESVVEGLEINTQAGGVVEIKGRLNNSTDTIDVVEILKFKEVGSEVLITNYEINLSYSDGKKYSNKRTYEPAITILKDKSALSVGDDFSTEGVNVDFEGDTDTVVQVDVSGALVVTPLTGLSDITGSVKVKEEKTISIAGKDTLVSVIEFNWDQSKKELWFPMQGLVVGELGLAKGIGIVSVAGQDAITTNAIK